MRHSQAVTHEQQQCNTEKKNELTVQKQMQSWHYHKFNKGRA